MPFLISRVIGYGIDADVFQYDHGRASLDNAEEDIVVTGTLKHDVKPETVTIKRQCRGNILYDEEWCDTGNFRFSHVSFPFLNLVKIKLNYFERFANIEGLYMP